MNIHNRQVQLASIDVAFNLQTVRLEAPHQLPNTHARSVMARRLLTGSPENVSAIARRRAAAVRRKGAGSHVMIRWRRKYVTGSTSGIGDEERKLNPSRRMERRKFKSFIGSLTFHFISSVLKPYLDL